MTELVWHDTATWGLEGKGWEDTARHFERLPARARESVREPVWDLSRFSAGLNLRFVTDSPQIHARYDLLNPTICMPHMPATSHSGLDLYGEDGSGFLRWVGITHPEGQHVEGALAEGLAPGRRPYCLYLPLYNSPETLEIGAKVAFAVQRMEVGGYRHLPIVGDTGELTGIISVRDILQYLTESLPEA